MSKLNRIIKLMLALNNTPSMNSRELAQLLNVSERTIMRDIQELSEVNFPVYSELGRDGGYSVLKNNMIPPIRFTDDEIEAIFFAIDSIKLVGGTPFETSFDNVLNKVLHTIPQETNKVINQIREKVILWQPKIEVDKLILKTLYLGIKNSEVIEINYKSISNNAIRRIEPVGIYLYNGFWYCPSYCHLRKSIRLFRLDRMLSAKLTNQKYSKANHLNLSKWFNSEYGSSPITLRVNLTKDGVRKCESIFWLRDGVTYYSDGSGVINKQVNSSEVDFYTDLIWTIGSDAVVLEPEEMAKRILNKAKNLIGRYREI